MTGIVGAIVEAWDELRIHKLRVLLALIGVACAVTAITSVTAVIAMLKQATQEQTDRQNGRQITLMVSAYPKGQSAATPAEWDTAFGELLDRYSITYASRDAWLQVPVRLAAGKRTIQIRTVDADLGTINRIVPVAGRWFTDVDETAFAPTLVVNESFLHQLGLNDLSSHPTVEIGDRAPVTATIVGVMANDWPQADPLAMALYTPYHRWIGADGSGIQSGGAAPPEGSMAASMNQQVPTVYLWVPSDQAHELTERITQDMQSVAPGWQVDVSDNAYRGGGLGRATTYVGIGIGGLALLLGGLGLVNIALVTVRYRIREIGIRRSFGATSGRVFFGVLLESVVATFVAGLVGVTISVAIIKNIPVDRLFGGGIQDMPPFPISAAVVGMLCATAVGALAGIIPASFAVRVRVIDAIRY
ncbi:ABC transporter permease [Cellulomonas sp. URHE0023]|uniref:ABC transporter permease n=1 Tax=Cellulomonas sp. URHE0023 TaxID=1380354 RepID=UPI0004831E19|nr:ABC transporter permease [Cellulomonas sp. URHE0023]